MDKRTWHYILPPNKFDIICPKCKGTNIQWSEYVHHIWCYKCNEDLELRNGYLFDGPILINLSVDVLSINFDRFNIETNEIELFNKKVGTWDPISKVESHINSLEFIKGVLIDEKTVGELKLFYGLNIFNRIKNYRELVDND
jgi:hypothetical protein